MTKKVFNDTYVCHVIVSLLQTLGGKKLGQQLASFYISIWNPANYALVGGIGVVINYLVFILLLSYFPWFVVNLLAIITAWSWNWLNSVGPLGYLWGFQHKNIHN